ncbi:MAG: hypothetical protein EBU90_29485, partial [Proteobacteria bacterium]|nr:hypothetical protein [Pseudomonadota bacterium]
IDSDIDTISNYKNIKDFRVLDRSKVIIKVPEVMKDKFPDHVKRGWGMEVADHILGQLFNIKECFSLIKKYQEKNNFTYDIIIRCRPDEFWFDSIKDIDLDAVLVNNCIATPQQYISIISGGYVNDRFAMGSFYNMEKYCNMFSFIGEYAKDVGPDEATEFYVDKHFRTNMGSVSIHNIDITFMLEYPGDHPVVNGFNPTTMRHLEQNDSNVAIAVAESLKKNE